MNATTILILTVCAAFCMAAGSAAADTPYLLSYQGTLLDDTGAPVPAGDYSMRFRLYKGESGGLPVYDETQTVSVAAAGIFDVILGKNANLKPSYLDGPRWLSVSVESQAEMTPRVELTTAPYSFLAAEVVDDAIDRDKIASNTVVRSINGVTEHVTLVEGPNVTIDRIGSEFTFSADGGGGVESLNGATGALNLVEGPNVSISQAGSDLTISASGGTGGDDGDWTIDGAHLYHEDGGTVSLGTDTPLPMMGGQTSLQVSSQYYPSIALDQTYSSLNRWLFINNGASGDLLFSHATSGNSSGTVSMVIADENRVAIGKNAAGATLDINAGNGDLVSTDGDLRVSSTDGAHELCFGVHIGGTEAGEASVFAKSTSGTARLNLGLDDHKVVTVEDNAFDFYGSNNQVQASLTGSTSGTPEGVFRLYGAESYARVQLDADAGQGGALLLRQDGALLGASLDMSHLGGGQLTLYDAAGQASISLDGTYSSGVGRIRTPELEITGGADLSEQFDVQADDASGGSVPAPGSVVSIDPSSPGGLRVSTRAYDRRVAGIISGAGGVRPGMLMGQKNSVADGEYPVALTGRVYVLADASAGSIEPGDLLTTSDTPGHAMKVTDHARANGAILGKAMTALEQGRGLVLVLVSLQ